MSMGYSICLRFGIRTESVVDANSPSHSLLPLDSGEHLGRVLKSDWSFPEGVTDRE